MKEDELEKERKLLLKIEKDKRIKKEINRLKKLYNEMPANTMGKVISLIKNAAFMTITLEDLQESINSEGAVSEYKNGENQFGTKKSPEIEIYNTMIKNHAGIIRQLTDLMPEKPKPEPKKEDPFLNILNRGKNG
jgi:hypothetical protein